MKTAKDWINHFTINNPELQSKFLNLTASDCEEPLKKLGLKARGGVAYESAENRVFGFEDIVVKFYRPGRWSTEALKEEVRFLKDLEKEKVSFVRLIGDLNSWNGLNFIIFEKVKGPVINDRNVLDEDSVRKMVHLVAKIHEVGRKRVSIHRAQFNPQAMSEGCFEVIKKAGFLPVSLRKRYAAVIGVLVDKFQLLGDIPVQRIHGDTYSGNILWKPEGPIFMDLDDFQVAPIALDVRLLSFSWRLETLPESMDRRERRKIQHNMVLDMYREVSAFPAIQEKVLPLLGAYRDIQFDAWFSARWNEAGFAENYKDDDITKKQYWEDSIEGLEDSINQ